MKLDNTTLRLIRAASQAVADECIAILSADSTLTGTQLFVPHESDNTAAFPYPPPAAEAPAPATPAKRTRAKAAPAEPVVVTTTPPVTNVEQPDAPAPAPAAPAPAPAAPAPAAPAPAPAPAPAAPAPAAVTLFNPPPQSTITDAELAAIADTLKQFPDKLRAYQAWRDSSEFLQPDGTLASGKGMPLSKIPNVGDNRDRLLDAIKRALV
jgi:hypothetical protein